MNIFYFYKVVRLVDQDLRSCMGGSGYIKYLVNKFVSPRKGYGPLCVFSTLALAEKFIRTNRANGYFEVLQIYSCQIIKSELDVIWNPLHRIEKVELPKGTILASSVKLRECVYTTKET